MLNAESLFPIFVAIATAALIFTILYPLLSNDKKSEKRRQAIANSHAVDRSTQKAVEAAAERRKKVSDKLKELESRSKKKNKVTLNLLLQRAGLSISPRAYWIACAAISTGCAVLTLVAMGDSIFSKVIALMVAFVGFFGLPRWFLGKLIKSRQQKFLRELANSIDVLIRGVKSGLPVNECLQTIAQEAPEPIASEFKEVVKQQRVGVTLSEALERMVERMPLPEVRFLAIVIGIQQKSGGNLAEALGNLTDVLRSRIRMKMKVKALSAEATASAAVLGALPPGVMILVYLSTPDYMMPLFQTKIGNFLLLAGAVWMSAGVLVMQRMINFKY